MASRYTRKSYFVFQCDNIYYIVFCSSSQLQLPLFSFLLVWERSLCLFLCTGHSFRALLSLLHDCPQFMDIGGNGSWGKVFYNPGIMSWWISIYTMAYYLFPTMLGRSLWLENNIVHLLQVTFSILYFLFDEFSNPTQGLLNTVLTVNGFQYESHDSFVIFTAHSQKLGNTYVQTVQPKGLVKVS